MKDFTPTDLDEYPGQPPEEALTWAINFCLRNANHLVENGSLPNGLINLTYDYYRAVLLAKNRYHKLMAFTKLELEPEKERPFCKRTYIRTAYDEMEKNQP